MPKLNKHHWSKLLIVTAFILVTIALLFGLKQNQDIRQRAYNPGHPDAKTSLSFTRTAGSLPFDRPFTVNLSATTGTNSLAGVEVHFHFNPTYLQLTTVTIGNLFPGVTSFTSGPNIATNGDVSFIILANTGQPALTTGNLAQLTFTPLSKVANTPITFINDLTKASAKDLPGIDVIKSLTNLNIDLIQPTDYCTPNATKSCKNSTTPKICTNNRWINQTACTTGTQCKNGICTDPIPGDIAEPYCTVDIFDYSVFLSSFGLSTGQSNYNDKADLVDDGLIDIFDYGIFLSNFGRTCPN